MEAIVAVAVMAIAISAASAMMIATERAAIEMAGTTQAAALAEEGIHAVISIRDRAWSNMALGAHGLAIQASPAEWIFQGLSDTSNGFTRTVTISSVDADTVKAVVLVTWSPDGKRTAKVEEQILLTDWETL